MEGIDPDGFPLEDVEASLRDGSLQREHQLSALPAEERQMLEEQRRDAVAAGASGHVKWIYFRSPPWTWEHLCGREGWLLYDPESKTQHGFLLVAMN